MSATPDDTQGTALLVIDLQQALCAAAPAVPMTSVKERIQTLLDWADANSHPVVFVQHWTEPGTVLERGSEGWQLNDVLRNHRPAFHVEKNTPSCFDSGSLQSWLQERGVRRLCIAGMQTEFCVSAACRAAHDLGFEVILPTDAHMTIDGPAAPAVTTVADYNEKLAAIARCLPTAALIGEGADWPHGSA